MIKVGSDFSGVGAFNQALIRLSIEYKELFACDMDKYARQTFVANYGEPDYYPTNVYDREIPTNSLDIYMTSPPCQAFSLAGKRLGKEDERGILFFNSHEFIIKNKPRFFIFENVKGLLSDDNGKTFQEWVNYLGGKSVNGLQVLFPIDEAAPYHIYWRVLNAKDFNIPQNRERVFIVGIRDDADNDFSWPKEQPLTKRLRDVLESEVDKKYFLSEKMVSYLVVNSETQKEKGNGFKFSTVENSDTAKAITTKPGQRMDDNFLKIKSATKSGFEVATENDSINYSVPKYETRRGRVGVGVAQTLDTSCNQAVMVVKLSRTEEAKRLRKEIFKETGKDTGSFSDREFKLSNQSHSDAILANMNPKKEGLIAVGTWRTHRDGNGFREIQDGNCPTIPARAREDGSGQPVICVPVLTGVSVHPFSKKLEYDGVKDICPTLLATDYKAPKCAHYTDYRIRRLTPRECFRLMDFPDSFTWPVSDSQAYKQAGNSICVGVLALIIKGLKKL